MKPVFRSIGFLFAFLFAIAAAVQYNDPDALIWIAIWGLAAVISLAFALNKVSSLVTQVMGILCFGGFFYLYPPKFEGFEIGAGDIVNIELGREAFGVLIIALIMFFYTIALRRSDRL